MKLIEARGIAHHFDYPLFNDINLTLEPHDSIAIVGVSGSGKSTLLHILSTLLRPDHGSVQMLGKPVDSLDNRRLVQLRRDALGIIFQSHYLFKGFSGMENLEVASILSGEPVDEALLKRLKIDQVIGQKVTELSGGQQQRVSIARVLTKKPSIIFADEPTGNLDAETADEVMALFEDYISAHQAGLVLVTHESSLAMRCKYVYKLENQRLVPLK
ncbi:MAG TPA: ABC transporter ATP-binding protein [Chlorobaculum parvum]|uniref:ABC transporter ATP-binding protein n=1 Tax=Chlorobaculum parvum TaxID=274539 RepID=A0A7C5HFP1_9CHLB|nr:ABC transporter ATP-binding protein [Chlorobaculum parvum]